MTEASRATFERAARLVYGGEAEILGRETSLLKKKILMGAVPFFDLMTTDGMEHVVYVGDKRTIFGVPFEFSMNLDVRAMKLVFELDG